MRDCNHSQAFTVFGGSYVTESHGFNCLPQAEGRKRSGVKMVAVASLLMLGVTGATAMKKVWDGGQSHRAGWVVAGFGDALY